MNTRIPDADGTHRLGSIAQDVDGDLDEQEAIAIAVAEGYGYQRPPDYLQPAAADPAVHRYPHQVAVAREQLGHVVDLGPASEATQSPVRAYLLRHLDDAQIQLDYAETAVEDATNDRNTRRDQVNAIVKALADLDDIEADRGRLSRMIVGPERTDTAAGDPHR